LIEVDQNRQVVQYLDGGVVTEILVDEGDLVTAGDVLVRLDAQDIQARLSVVEGQLFEILAGRARFEAERDSADTLAFDPLLDEGDADTVQSLKDGQNNLFDARLDSVARRSEQLANRKDQIASQMRVLLRSKTRLEPSLA
jgi:multidrug efflux pump subunit AcrA (membrane-fusion protein)